MSYEYAETLLNRRGIQIESIADIVFQLQLKYYPHLTMEECVESVKAVLQKREVQYTLLTGIALDDLVAGLAAAASSRIAHRSLHAKHYPASLDV
ncbi:hypothetical protein C1I59_07775 [Paenibacillus polymyxa]|uniref:hypothetical protein n=1 Tax=Paenibacillus polymyxa TaxID=1406 RepID=UPI0010BE9108|nr:hypothetical protein [Paenibacillus polymyxa]TKH37882.1 hypothetical protein C1I59_07775 [Paenibacillus polymyxa]